MSVLLLWYPNKVKVTEQHVQRETVYPTVYVRNESHKQEICVLKVSATIVCHNLIGCRELARGCRTVITNPCHGMQVSYLLMVYVIPVEICCMVIDV